MTVDSNCAITARDYCTQNPTGKFMSTGNRITYTCPDGYTMNSSHTQCTRAGGAYSTNGTDTNGSYTITYAGSCEPDRIMQECANATCTLCTSCEDWLTWGEP